MDKPRLSFMFVGIGIAVSVQLISGCASLAKPGWVRLECSAPCTRADGEAEIRILVQDEMLVPLQWVEVTVSDAGEAGSAGSVVDTQVTDPDGRLVAHVQPGRSYAFKAAQTGFATEVRVFKVVDACPVELLVTLKAIMLDCLV
jgi:hypothetical protein